MACGFSRIWPIVMVYLWVGCTTTAGQRPTTAGPFLWQDKTVTSIRLQAPLTTMLARKTMWNSFRYDPDVGEESPSWVVDGVLVQASRQQYPAMVRFLGGRTLDCSMPSIHLRVVEPGGKDFLQTVDVHMPCGSATEDQRWGRTIALYDLYAAYSPLSLRTEAISLAVPLHGGREESFLGYVVEPPEEAARRFKLALTHPSMGALVPREGEGMNDEDRKRLHQLHGVVALRALQNETIEQLKAKQKLAKATPVEEFRNLVQDIPAAMENAGLTAPGESLSSPDMRARLGQEWEARRGVWEAEGDTLARQISPVQAMRILVFQTMILHDQWALFDFGPGKSPAGLLLENVMLLQNPKNRALVPIPSGWGDAGIFAENAATRAVYRKRLNGLRQRMAAWPAQHQKHLQTVLREIGGKQEDMLRAVQGNSTLRESDKRAMEQGVAIFLSTVWEVFPEIQVPVKKPADQTATP